METWDAVAYTPETQGRAYALCATLPAADLELRRNPWSWARARTRDGPNSEFSKQFNAERIDRWIRTKYWGYGNLKPEHYIWTVLAPDLSGGRLNDAGHEALAAGAEHDRKEADAAYAYLLTSVANNAAQTEWQKARERAEGIYQRVIAVSVCPHATHLSQYWVAAIASVFRPPHAITLEEFVTEQVGDPPPATAVALPPLPEVDVANYETEMDGKLAAVKP